MGNGIVKPIYEIMKEVEDAATPAKRKKVLKDNAQNGVLLSILKHAFDPDITWLVDGDVQYKKLDAPPELTYGRIYQEARRFYVFTNPDLNITPAKRDRLWLDLLESLAPEDAEIVASLPKKKLPFGGITAKTVKSAFPDLF